jgi:hypothetical protein
MLRGTVTPLAPGAGRGGHGAGDATNRVPYCAPRAWGVPPPADFERRWLGGEATPALAASYGVSRDRLTSWRKQLGLPARKIGKPVRKWPDWRRRAFREAWLRGDSGPAMAERFGLSVRAVYALREDMGLPPRWPPRDPAPFPAAKAPPAAISAASSEAPQMALPPDRPERLRECGYVISGPPWLYCGAATERGRSMCEAHRASCLARAA